MTEKQFKELWNSFSENTKAFMQQAFSHYDWACPNTWVRKKHRHMVQRYFSKEQMCRVISNWMLSSLDYGARSLMDAYRKYKTVESKHFWPFIGDDPSDPQMKELWDAVTAKVIVGFEKQDLEHGIDRFDQEQMTFSEIESLFRPYGCLVKKKKEIRVQWWAEFEGKTKGRHIGTPTYFPSTLHQLTSIPCNQFKGKWLKSEVMKIFNEMSSTWMSWPESHALRPASTYASMVKRNDTDLIERIKNMPGGINYQPTA